MTEELKERIEQIANENNWECGIYINTSNRCSEYIEFQSYTPEGQDLFVTIENDNFETLQDVSDALYVYANNYDPDYEAYIWLGEDGHGKEGAPYHMRDVLDDMEAARQMIYNLSEVFSK